ncbi:MAG TPA: integrase [Euryarchaeota archaeon]|nr:integrase [Euryarchaeota archaeon]
MKNNHRSDLLFFSMTYEFLEVYLTKQCGRSPHTVESYRDALSLFRRYILNTVGISIGKFTFAECTRECVLGFMNYLSELKSKPSTRNQRLAALKSYLMFAADKDITLQSNELEVRRVPQCRVPKTEKTVIPEDAMTAILQQPSNTKMGLRDRTIMILLYDSGARLAEVLGLKVSDVAIDGANPYIRVNGKGSKQRIVPILVKTAAHLAHYISVYHTKERPDTDLLFFTVIKNIIGMMSEGNVERFVKEYARKAQSSCSSVPDHVHPHMFRRTRATQLYQNGVSLPLVSRLLGHASLETTRLYAKPSLKMLRDAIESVETSEEKAVKPIWEGDEAMMAKLSGLR